MDNRRKTIVINKPFQYQHSLMIAALAVLLLNGFLIVRLVFPGDDPLGMTTGQLTGLAILELLLIGSVWYGCLKASHRIAGPVYVFAREIGRLGKGDLNARIVLREKDNFRPEAEQKLVSNTTWSNPPPMGDKPDLPGGQFIFIKRIKATCRVDYATVSGGTRYAPQPKGQLSILVYFSFTVGLKYIEIFGCERRSFARSPSANSMAVFIC